MCDSAMPFDPPVNCPPPVATALLGRPSLIAPGGDTGEPRVHTGRTLRSQSVLEPAKAPRYQGFCRWWEKVRCVGHPWKSGVSVIDVPRFSPGDASKLLRLSP